MRIETIIGWRDEHYPGEVTYGERATWDATALYEAAATLDKMSVGYAVQMAADNQFFASIERQLHTNTLRQTIGLLGAPDQYSIIEARRTAGEGAGELYAPLPMSKGQPDFVFSDETDGVVAIKHGDEIVYVSLYWRARNAINFLARVHDITPLFERVATVHEDEQFTPSGLTFTRPDYTNFGFGNGGPRYPEVMHSANAGEKLPIAKVPAGVAFRPGDENPYAGRANFYVLQYGPYLIGMNSTSDRNYALIVPANFRSAKDLVSQSPVNGAGSLNVPPRSTVVLFSPL